MRNLAATNRCHLFEQISDEVWQHIVHNHGTLIRVSEIGLTNNIISSIRSHSNRIPNFGIWANPGYNESVFGSDLDIFVETTTGFFIWYAMQAKVLEINGTYHGMAQKRNGEYQWDKLNRLRALSGCISKYLLYNGIDDFIFAGYDSCRRAFTQEQYGCSLVEPSEVERISLLRTPSFKDFHPTNAQPWRVILCCLQNTSKTSLYTSKQVQRAVSTYPNVYANDNILKQTDNETASNEVNISAINDYSESVGWKPFYRLVIRTTTGLNS